MRWVASGRRASSAEMFRGIKLDDNNQLGATQRFVCWENTGFWVLCDDGVIVRHGDSANRGLH